MKGRTIAVFDLDGTLTRGRSVESAFVLHLLGRRLVPPGNLFGMLGFYLRNLLHDPSGAVKRNKMYLRGIKADYAASLIEDFMSGRGVSLLSARRLELVKSHRALGHSAILISGTIKALTDALDIGGLFDRIYCTALEKNGGVYTGLIDGPHYFGRAKAELVLRLFEELGADFESSFCYADSASDIPMMSLFGNPVAVCPGRALRAEALRKNWKIVD